MRSSLLVLVAAGAFLAGCLGRRVPSVPVVDGPDAVQPGDTALFWAWSQDPDRGNLCYLFDWGDSSPSNWSAELAAGDTLFRSHVYAETGRYQVRVKCRDLSELESAWSEPEVVLVAFFGPLAPARPDGPGQAQEGEYVVFQTSAGHVRAESVSVQFDWGDTLGSWSSFAPAGTFVQDSHAYGAAGDYAVRARAQDHEGNVSPWSAQCTVWVSIRPLEPPTGLVLRASGGTSVRVRWQTGHNPDTTEYWVWFQALEDTAFELVAVSKGTSAFHDPRGETGDYTVSTLIGEAEHAFAAETVSTKPVFTDTVLLHELNASGHSAYGWDTLTGTGQALSMRESASAGRVDLYFSDFEPGTNGPYYFFCSTHLGPEDPGGVVPPGSWRSTGLLGYVGNPQGPLPEYDSLLYEDAAEVRMAEDYCAVYTEDGRYALVKHLGLNPDSASVRVLSWFQAIRGLRLIQHEESGGRQ